MNFLVVITCAAHIACPIKGTLRQQMPANSAVECQEKVGTLISTFTNLKASDFKIICEKR